MDKEDILPQTLRSQELEKQNFSLKVVVFFLLFILMNIQYSINLDSRNLIYPDFERGSQNLAEAAIFAGTHGLPMPNYGLGHLGKVVYAEYDEKTDRKITSDVKVIPILENHYTEKYIIAGLRFESQDGEVFTLQNVKNKDDIRYLYFDKDVTSLRSQEQLDYCVMVNTEGETIPFSAIRPYTKQYGLQGKIYYHIARLTSVEFAEKAIRFCCTFLLSTVIMGICLLVYKKYKDIKLAAAFFFGFFFSPWIAAFSPNFYWVEFTWFIPMLIGLLYVCYKKQRLIWFVAAFVAVFAKSLCGFEYLSTILMGLVIFPVAEYFKVSEQKEKKRIIFDTAIFTGLSIAGFLGAFTILANILGEGNIINGMQTIYQRDVLSKTFLGNQAEFSGVLHQAVGSSVVQVINEYFHFPTDIITGISGSLFVPMILVAIVGMIYMVYKKEKNYKALVILFVFSFCTSLSWMVLGKAHSFIHLHLNFVLWYFGFIQMVLYVWIYLIVKFYRKTKDIKNKRHKKRKI